MSGNISTNSNGDHLHVATNPLLFFLDALGLALDLAGEDLLAALEQMDPLAAEGEWADLWGAYFGVARREGESDADYTARIFVEVTRPRNNRYALENTLSEFTGSAVTVQEPWRQVIHGSGYAPGLSRHRLRDARFWTHGTISVAGADRNALQPVVDAHRAAGVWPTYLATQGADPVALTPDVGAGAVAWIQPPILGGVELEWLAAPFAAGPVLLGNEPWTWQAVAGRMAHVSPLVDGHEHAHGAYGLPTLAPTWMDLALPVWLDPDDTPSTLLVGFRCDGDWRYVYWGPDLCAESPREPMGPLPETGYWVNVTVSTDSLGLSGPVTIDGAFFALYGGAGAFGPVIARLEGDALQESYRIGGVPVIDLYSLDGDYVFGLGLTDEYGEALHRLEPSGTGGVTHTFRAGEGWRLGDMVSLIYMAGHTAAYLTPATWGASVASVHCETSKVS